jgi:hypothetical protein
MTRRRVTAGLAGVAVLAALAATADENAPADAGAPAPLPPAGEAYEVERVEADEPKHPTLRFLGENRDFFRARLDDLRLLLREGWDGQGEDLDPRWLAWREMLDEINAAGDSAAVSEEWIRRRELLDSVGELVELELEMDEMEELLVDQGERLTRLEEDFVGRQQTALVVLVKGAASRGTPETVILTEADGPAHRIALTERVRGSLERGGSAELFHRLVEPREHHWEVSFEGEGWSDLHVPLDLEPERDRMTFLEIDLSQLDPIDGEARPASRWWVR